jgi:spermidine synthase
MGGTVYSFSIILSVFLAGLGTGSGAGSLIARTCSNPRKALALCQLLLALGIAWAAFLIAQSLPYWPINPSMYTNEWGPWHVFQLDLLRAAWMIFPSALLWGASFPLAVASVVEPGNDSGRAVGAIYASNTLGSILGSLGFSLLVIPRLGTLWAERLLILAAVAAAIVAFTASVLRKYSSSEEQSRHIGHPFSSIVYSLLGIFLAIFLFATVTKTPWMLVAWGRFCAYYTAQAEPDIIDENKQQPEGNSPSKWFCTYLGEGMNISVAVTRTGAGTRFFHGAGKVQASSLPRDMRLQRMLGHLSALTCKDPDKVKDVLVVACGAGVTAGSFITYPNVRRIVICDIEPLVPKFVAPMFGKENYHVVDGIERQNPRFVNGKEVSVVYDDGRHYLHTLPDEAKFDIITSDPIDPWVKGSAALNTVEYYEMCKRHLKPGGVMSLWMPLYESNLATAKSLIATFFRVFPNALIFSNDENLEGYDAVLLGQAEPSQINVDYVQELLEKSEYSTVRDSLREVGFGHINVHPELLNQEIAVHLLSTFAGQASRLGDWTRNAQINRDTNLRLQYLAGMHFNSYISTRILESILFHYEFPQDVFTGSEQRLAVLRKSLSLQGRR